MEDKYLHCPKSKSTLSLPRIKHVEKYDDDIRFGVSCVVKKKWNAVHSISHVVECRVLRIKNEKKRFYYSRQQWCWQRFYNNNNSFYALVLIQIKYIKSRPENNTRQGFRELLSVFVCHTLHFIYIHIMILYERDTSQPLHLRVNETTTVAENWHGAIHDDRHTFATHAPAVLRDRTNYHPLNCCTCGN